MRLTLVRHGQSEANIQRLVTGNKNIDCLSALGVTQMQHTAALLRRMPFEVDQFFTSDFRRAQESAAHLMLTNTLVIDGRLGETHAGDVAELPLTTFLRQWPDFYLSNSNRYPGGESHDELNLRVLSWLQEVRASCRGHVLAVTHAGPIACLLQHALNIPMNAFPALLARNASISVIEYANERDRGKVLAFSLLPEASMEELLGTYP